MRRATKAARSARVGGRAEALPRLPPSAPSSAGRGRGEKGVPRRAYVLDAVDAQSAPVRASAVPGDEIPARLCTHEASWLHPANAGAALYVAVAQLDHLLQLAGVGQRSEMAQVGGRCCVRQWLHRIEKALEAARQPRRQERLELHRSHQSGLLQAAHAAQGSASQCERERESLVLLEGQGRELGAGLEMVAALGTWQRPHPVAEFAQSLYIPSDGARRDTQPLGQLRPAPRAALLQQAEQPQEAGRGGQHADFE